MERDRLVPIGLLTLRVRTALETIAAHLCWVPPLVGWWTERAR